MDNTTRITIPNILAIRTPSPTRPVIQRTRDQRLAEMIVAVDPNQWMWS